MKARWTWKVFPKSGIAGYELLETEEFAKIASHRSEIFNNEQKYPYNDFDGRDQHAIHLLCYDDSVTDPLLIGYARLMLPKYNHVGPDDQKGELEVGRVTVRKGFRKLGIGSSLMQRIIEKIDADFPEAETHLSYTVDEYAGNLKAFYEKFGFKLKSGDAHSTSPYYHYDNFSCEIYDMIRPAHSLRLDNEAKASCHAPELSQNAAVNRTVMTLNARLVVISDQFNADDEDTEEVVLIHQQSDPLPTRDTFKPADHKMSPQEEAFLRTLQAQRYLVDDEPEIIDTPRLIDTNEPDIADTQASKSEDATPVADQPQDEVSVVNSPRETVVFHFTPTTPGFFKDKSANTVESAPALAVDIDKKL